MTSALLEQAPCHVAIVRGYGQAEDHRRILVATDGSFFSRAAVELAVLYAEEVGGEVTVLYSMDADPSEVELGSAASGLDEGFRRMMATTLLTTLSPLLTRTSAKVRVMVRESSQQTAPVLHEAASGLYSLLVVGAENRAVQHRLSVGYDVERLVRDAPCAVVVVVPKIGAAAPPTLS
jgi:nucleotide-binding universal stress UspA family protein